MALRSRLHPIQQPASHEPISPPSVSAHASGDRRTLKLVAVELEPLGSAVAREPSSRAPGLASPGFWFYIIAMILCASPFVAKLVETIVK
jgi:hypothetical protein